MFLFSIFYHVLLGLCFPYVKVEWACGICSSIEECLLRDGLGPCLDSYRFVISKVLVFCYSGLFLFWCDSPTIDAYICNENRGDEIIWLINNVA